MPLIAFSILFLLGFGVLFLFEKRIFEKPLFGAFVLAFGLGLSLFVLLGRLFF